MKIFYLWEKVFGWQLCCSCVPFGKAMLNIIILRDTLGNADFYLFQISTIHVGSIFKKENKTPQVNWGVPILF